MCTFHLCENACVCGSILKGTYDEIQAAMDVTLKLSGLILQ